MKVLITGAAGFLGTRLVKALLDEGAAPFRAATIVAADIAPCTLEDARVDARVGTITDARFIASIVDDDVDVVFHLAAVVSGQAEAEFDLGMRVNVDATRALLEECRSRAARASFVFTSTVAVFGAPVPHVVPEDWVVRPQSSYGAEKLIGETLVLEYSRRGFVDGVVCRLPTVAVRPGRPNAAVSSFVSGIVREPLAGVACVCPVPLETRLWVSSPGAVIANLLHAARLPAPSLAAGRVVNLPGLSITAGDMLASLERLGGPAARALVRCEPDPRIMAIVGTWPGAFDVTRPLGLGFVADRDVDELVAQYIEAT